MCYAFGIFHSVLFSQTAILTDVGVSQTTCKIKKKNEFNFSSAFLPREPDASRGVHSRSAAATEADSLL